MKKWFALLLAAIMCFSLAACNSGSQQETSHNERPANLPVGEVEVTLDNWQEYFDMGSIVEARTNSFGEVENAWVSTHIKLKDEYNVYCGESNIAFEIKLTQPYMCAINGNIKTGEYQITKKYTSDEVAAKGETDWLGSHSEMTPMGEYNIYNNITDDGLSIGNCYPINDTLSASEDGVTFDTILYENCELVRVKGTLTFKDKPTNKIDLEHI